MSWVALSKQKHLDKAVSKTRNYYFAGKESLVELYAFELPAAVATVPIAFAKDGDGPKCCGVLGLEKNTNLFINSSGEWESPFIPAVLQTYPFRLGASDDGNKYLFFKEDSECIVDKSDGYPLFNEDGTMAEIVSRYMHLFGAIDASTAVTRNACALIEKHDLLEQFSLDLQKADGGKMVGGPWLRIKERVFSELDDKAFLELRNAKALELIYAHFYSLKCLSNLVVKMNMKEKTTSGMRALGAKIFETEHGEIDFNLS